MYVLAISSTTNCDLHLQEFEVDGHKAFPNVSAAVVLIVSCQHEHFDLS